MSTTMDTTSFSSRRQAATSLPQFHLPTPANVPSMPPKSFATAPPLNSSLPPPASANNVLTPPLGVPGEGLSPLSSANTGSSQTSGAPTGLSGYYGHSHGSWPTPGTSNSSYTFGSANQQGQSLTQPGYGGRGMYGQSGSISYGSRNPQSPTTGIDGLNHSSYDPGHQPYSTAQQGGADASGSSALGNTNAGLGMGPSTASQGGGGGGGGGGILPGVPAGSGLPGAASAPSGLHRHSQSSQGSILGSQTPTNPQPSSTTSPGAGAGPVDPYSQSRSPPTQSYYTPVSSSTSSTFQSYASPPQGSSVHPPASSTGPPRPLGSMIPPSGMAPPQHYRNYPQYPQMPHMGGPIMSNMGNPGGQMSLVAGMHVNPPYGQMTHRLYGPGGQQHQQERPFSCDQCAQSFNRNHDLKRHKRIHLAVKPFPCSSCDKSFSRKDALKVSNLLRGVTNSRRVGPCASRRCHHGRGGVRQGPRLINEQRHRLVKNCDKDSNKQDSSKRRDGNDPGSRGSGGDVNQDMTR